MNLQISDAVQRFHREGFLDDRQAEFFLRVARRQLVSVRFELQMLLYGGILLVLAGAGALAAENIERIGPPVVSSILGLAAAACLIYVFRRSPPFSREEVPSPSLAFDYVLLLGALLAGSALAYLETQFALFGPDWHWHLLIVSLFYLAAAFRFDSRAVLSLALTTFAAWRGISTSAPLVWLTGGREEAIRLDAIATGSLFLAAAFLTLRSGFKRHFEPVWTNLGLILVLGGLLSGVWERRWQEAAPWLILLAAAVAATTRIAYRRRRSSNLALAVLAGWLAFIRLVFEFDNGAGALLFVAFSSLVVLWLIRSVHRRMREEF